MKISSGKILTAVSLVLVSAGALAGDAKVHHDKMTAQIAAEMQMMDSNRDGKLSGSEHAAGAQQMFQAMDGNQDGRVTVVEMDAAQKPIKAADASHGREDSKGTAEMSSAEKIKVVDKNGDGVLTAKEHEQGAKEMFGKMDADRDGYLTADELAAGHAKYMTAEDR